ncbi:MAG: hypothetical protein FWD61_15220 [Phycisphaerales bacterium]|nr:hypothetical protein [Phycisphaerales bacterium]
MTRQGKRTWSSERDRKGATRVIHALPRGRSLTVAALMVKCVCPGGGLACEPPAEPGG